LKNELIEIIRINSRPLKPLPTKYCFKTSGIKVIKSIIFDIYGTLLISSSGDIGTLKEFTKNEIFLESLKNAGIMISSKEAGQKGLDYFYDEIKLSHNKSKKNSINYPEVIITDIWKSTLKRLIKEKLIITELTDSIILKIATIFECRNNNVWPMPGLLDIIKYLKNRQVVLGIVSNAQFYTPLLFNAFTGSSLVDLGFDTELIEYSYISKEAKPSLKMFNSIIYKLHTKYKINPSNTLYVGNDMLNDIYSANKAGLKTALFAGDKRSLKLRKNTPEVSDINPDFIITDLMQISELIK
jgi:putative hydrolase of the HAD superfamily